ncbi:MAG: helix-turn-helix domain-containing protein [Candidatus Bathyarchaeota archaeon]|nr:helix-turn-helix domain-containing protein [Candidatus Bathyarchaeota archaeon]MDH5786809.1 helix-turn-helix domain-containing protein [Candidatus Bathyarchaeota archaeon]
MARISVFKGREARFNKAIFWVLAQQGSLTIYDIWRKLRTQRDFIYIGYNTVNRRVRALEECGYVEKSGERKTKTGFAARLYQLTARAYVAILLDKINLDDFIEKAPDTSILHVMAAFILQS